MPKIMSNLIDQAAGLRQLSRTKPVQVIAVTAGKGGAGKSNVSVNLAISLAQMNKNVMLLDADLGMANVDLLLGLHAKYNLSHVLQGHCDLSDIIIPGPHGIKIIPAASGTEFMTQLTSVEHAGIINAFNELTDNLDYLIIDTAAGISDTVLSFARSSHEIIVVVCDEPTSLADAYALIKVMSKRYEWTSFNILANMVRETKDGQELFNKIYKVSEQFLDVQLKYLGAIPFDEHVHQSVKKQQAVVMAYPYSKAALSFKVLGNKVDQWISKPMLDGNTQFFLERLVASEF